MLARIGPEAGFIEEHRPESDRLGENPKCTLWPTGFNPKSEFSIH